MGKKAPQSACPNSTGYHFNSATHFLLKFQMDIKLLKLGMHIAN
jgi:hypothetical protein